MSYSDFIPQIILCALAFIASLYFLKWILKVDENMKNQQKQIELLSKLSEKLGVPMEEIIQITHGRR